MGKLLIAFCKTRCKYLLRTNFAFGHYRCPRSIVNTWPMKTRLSLFGALLIGATLSCALASPIYADTLAYWRFENGSPGEYTAIGRIADSDSAGQNLLSAYARETRPLYSGDVPFASVPQTKADNRIAVDLHYSEDFFTPEVPLNTFDFSPQGSNAWTIELSFKMAGVDGVSRLAGRDGVTPDVDERGPLQILVQRQGRINLMCASKFSTVATLFKMR